MTFTAMSHRKTANMGDNIRPAEAPGAEGVQQIYWCDYMVFCHPVGGEFLLFRIPSPVFVSEHVLAA
jgi:hypothetical protein